MKTNINSNKKYTFNHINMDKPNNNITPIFPEPKWIKWKDTIKELNYYTLTDQITWLKDTIYKDNKNFYFYLKRHNTLNNLLIIRESARLRMSNLASEHHYWRKKYNPNIEKSIQKSMFKINKQVLLENNKTYKSEFDKITKQINDTNKKLAIIRKRILALDENNSKLIKMIKNKEQLLAYLLDKNNKTITTNYTFSTSIPDDYELNVGLYNEM